MVRLLSIVIVALMLAGCCHSTWFRRCGNAPVTREYCEMAAAKNWCVKECGKLQPERCRASTR